MTPSTAGSERRRPVVDLLRRYGAVFQAAWQARAELTGPKRLADEAAFLPAALSLQETPPHPAPRRVAWAICALFVLAVAWACFGEIDIVAIAPGRIVVSERSKTIQPLEASVVRRVLVRDGEAVSAGQVLIELDATNASADAATVREQLASVDSEARRAAALLDAMRRDAAPALPPSTLGAPAGAKAGDGDRTEHSIAAQLAAEWQDISAKLARLAAEQSRRRAEIQTVRELIGKLEATLPIARQREADFRSLTEQGFISAHAGQDRMRERIEQERDLATQRARLVEAHSALAEAEQTRASYVAETKRLLGERHAQAMTKREQLVQERSKNEQRSRLTLLSSPVAGTVQQLAVHTEGGIVTPAQVLMIVVPKDAAVTAEVAVDNKDIGFVHAGDSARVKLETFPFTRYGTVDARVRTVTADAVTDERRGAFFPATLTLARNAIDIDGKRIHLSPGMNLTAEIRTGKRRVIEYLLSPVQQALGESLGER